MDFLAIDFDVRASPMNYNTKEISMHEVIEKINDHWFSLLAGLFTSWLMLRQKYIKDEYNTMKDDIQKLKEQHAGLDATLKNVQTNQKLMRDSQMEIGRDVKAILKQSSPKKWWQ